MNHKLKTLSNGLFLENPIFVLLLGMCPTLATTTSVINAFGMGLSTTAVLICSNAVISVLRKVIPSKIRIASYIVVIAAFVTVVEMLLNAYLPELAKQLGIFIPLIVVNCIILARAEAFAACNTIVDSAIDGLGMGLGFTAALSIIAFVRELLGAGSILGYNLISSPATIMILAPGGYLTLGCILAIINIIKNRKGADIK